MLSPEYLGFIINLTNAQTKEELVAKIKSFLSLTLKSPSVEFKYPEQLLPDVLEIVNRNPNTFIIEHPQGKFHLLLPLSNAATPIGFFYAPIDENTFTTTVNQFLLFLKEFIKIQYQKIELANKLLEEESEERHILESLNIGIVIVDTKFLIKRYNQNFLIMFDIEESIENRPLKNTLPPHIFSLFLQLKEEIETKNFALEKIFDFTFTFGKTVKYALSISTFNYGGENNYIFIVRDLTYTQEIERLKSLDAQKNTFLAHVSHELKTPLTAIMGYVELLSQFETDPQKKTFLQNIYEQSQSMLQMIQNLITITKIELGKLKLNITQFDIVELTKKVIELFQTSKIHIFSTYFSPSQILIWADKEKVREILLNLISNAVKYSPQGGGIKVEIKTLPTTNSVQIAIADQGIGIPEESLPYIFEKFYRVENPLTAKIQGTGLGLSIVKGLVELHGGKISVKSVKDKGTTFFITLPVKKVLL